MQFVVSMPKRKCTFSEALQKDFGFLKKIGSNGEVNCTHCNVTFSITHGGRSDINDHVKSARHKTAVEGLASRGSLILFVLLYIDNFVELG
jgi:undecaprenyl pyrophosphate synthase